LSLGRLNLTAKSLKTLCSLPHLRRLSLRFDLSMSKDDYKPLRQLRNLEELCLEEPRVSDWDVAMVIRNNPTIKVLSFSGGSISDEALQGLGACKALQQIECVGTALTGRFFANLANNVKLSKVRFEGDSVPDVSCEHIACVAHIKELSLAGSRVTAKGVQ